MTLRSRLFGLVTIIVLFVMVPSMFAQGRHQRRLDRQAESAKPQAVDGGVQIQVESTSETAYNTALKLLQESNYLIDIGNTNKEVGQITTQMKVVPKSSKGVFKALKANESGIRVSIVLSKNGESGTTVKVTVTEQERANHVQADAWKNLKLNSEESQAIADKLKATLQGGSEPVHSNASN